MLSEKEEIRRRAMRTCIAAHQSPNSRGRRDTRAKLAALLIIRNEIFKMHETRHEVNNAPAGPGGA